jgi:hypothetical protein
MGDECSKAKLIDCTNLSILMKKFSKTYKTAFLSYRGAGNEDLKNQLRSLVLSSERGETREQDSRFIPSDVRNIADKLSIVADWFNNENQGPIDSENYLTT